MGSATVGTTTYRASGETWAPFHHLHQHYRDIDCLKMADAQGHPTGRAQLRREPLMDIVSIEFVILADLDGTSGANRNLPRNHSGAQNDRQVIEFWLADYEDPRTREKYRSEA
jgi:hypothetical protein